MMMSEECRQPISFTLQAGPRKEDLVIDASNLTLISIKRLVCSFIEEKFPNHGILKLIDRLLLFKHDYSSTNILQVRKETAYYPRVFVYSRFIIQCHFWWWWW